jgi:hypothetical protein
MSSYDHCFAASDAEYQRSGSAAPVSSSRTLIVTFGPDSLLSDCFLAQS